MSIARGVGKYLKIFIQPATSHYCTNADHSDANTQDMSNNQRRNRIVWIDMEMTGLAVESDRILEVACLITDENLNIVSDEFHQVLHQSDDELARMNEWCQEHHTKSGLVEASKKSQEDERSVDKSLYNFLNKYIPKGRCPMAGNSVYMDRLFLRKYMPTSNEYMHYRIIDVSSIKEVVRRWKPEVHDAAPKKERNHRSLDDIRESISELDFYRKNVFNANSND
ncbi:oligoribonuclease [Nasonia vitripennis]|uniref:Probable oligoribonuclease n=1 Tax=Nasonia vitripennis TaxID=7425 RepID=A0A7M7M1N8_NASVI|nr:oligoribonuclease [Nasonia vitripennis]